MATDPFASVAALPGVSEATTRARDVVDSLLQNRVLRDRSAEVAAESALRGARASARLEGTEVALDSLRSGESPDDPVMAGALRVTAEVGPLRGTWKRAPRQALARLHSVAGAGLLPDEELGRPRSGSRVDDPLGLGTPPPPDEVALRLDMLARIIVEPTQAPGIVVAAVVHGELMALQPFTWGNGLVARAVERLVLVARGVDPKAVSVPEVGHAELAEGYVAALRGYIDGSPEGMAVWVGHCAEAVALGAREGLAVCEAQRRG